MPYITTRILPQYKQYTMEELMFGNIDMTKSPEKWRPNTTRTKTVFVWNVPEKQLLNLDVPKLIKTLEDFNNTFAALFEVDRHTLYRTFTIPKKSGGRRTINAPQPQLMLPLRVLRTIFENDFHALYHTNAFAYIEGRSIVDAVRKHQQNDSRWFLHTDFSDFFGSTTLEFVLAQFSMIFPFSEVMKVPAGRQAMERALSLCFLDGGLPQGTPISPLITNIMMIPIDFKLANTLRNFDRQHFILTRYADDMTISCRYDFNYSKIIDYINSVLREFHAPFKIKDEKTHYGSRAGRNWMLGLMLNKDNNITLGHKRKKALRSWIYNYLSDRQNRIPTPVQEIMELNGNLSYFKMVEPAWTEAIIEHYSNAFKVDLIDCIRADIAA